MNITDIKHLKAYFIFKVVKLVCSGIHTNFKVIISLNIKRYLPTSAYNLIKGGNLLKSKVF